MKNNWRNFKKEKPEVFGYYICCNADREELLGDLLYKPDYGHFVSFRAVAYLEGARFIEEVMREVTHFMHRNDLQLPEREE